MVAPRLSLELGLFGADNAEYYLRATGLASGIGYDRIEAVSDSSEEGFAFVAHPLMPAIVSMPMRLFGKNMAVAHITLYLLELLAFSALFWSAKQYLSPRTAVWLTAVFMLNPSVLNMAPLLMSDVLFLGASIGLFVLFERLLKTPGAAFSQWLLLGAGFGALTWLRYAGLFWIFGAVLWLLSELILQRDKNSLKRLLAFSAGSATLIGILALWIMTEEPGFPAFYFGLQSSRAGSPAVDPVSYIKAILTRVFDYKNILLQLIVIGPEGIYNHATRLIAYLGALLVGAPVLYLVWKKRRDLTWLRWTLFGLMCLAPYVGGSSGVKIRYIFPLLFFLIVPALFGVARFVKDHPRFNRKLDPERAGRMYLAVFAALYIALALPTSLKCYKNGSDAQWSPMSIEYREVYKWLGMNKSPSAVLLPIGDNYYGPAFTGMRSFVNSDLSKDDFAVTVEELSRVIVVTSNEWIDDRKGGSDRNPATRWFVQYRHLLKPLHRIGNTSAYELDVTAYNLERKAGTIPIL